MQAYAENSPIVPDLATVPSLQWESLIPRELLIEMVMHAETEHCTRRWAYWSDWVGIPITAYLMMLARRVYGPRAPGTWGRSAFRTTPRVPAMRQCMARFAGLGRSRPGSLRCASSRRFGSLFRLSSTWFCSCPMGRDCFFLFYVFVEFHGILK